MATRPPSLILSHGFTGQVGVGAVAADEAAAAVEDAWTEIHAQAARLALLACIAPEPAPNHATFCALIQPAPAWQKAFVMQGLDDIGAMLTSGLAALATLSGRGQDTAAPALALWREFHAARAALLRVLRANEDA